MRSKNLQPTRNFGVSTIVAGGAGGVITQIFRRPAALGCSSGYGGRHTANIGNSQTLAVIRTVGYP
jgi:hypothetical protein